MAKAKAVATPKATAAPVAAASPETLAQLEAGLRPYTLLAGRHHELETEEDGKPGLSKAYSAGDVVYSKQNLEEKWPGRFVAGVANTNGQAVQEAPGLGESVNEAIDTNGYDVYTKGGVIWAYVPGKYGSPASPALMDLVAAEEWCAANPVE
jgi:hypothetical protein